MHITYLQIYSTILLSFITFFSTLSPINCLIVFLRLTSEHTKEERKEVKNKSVLIASIILIVLMLIGPSGFKLLGIDLYSVKIAGGIILAIVSVGMVFGIKKEITKDQLNQKTHITVVPLALPIIAGPSAIVSAIILFAEYDSYLLKLLVFLTLIINLVIVYLLFTMADVFVKYIKKSILNILFILAGIILTALATQFIVDGIKDSGILKNFSYNNNKSAKQLQENPNA